MIQVRVDAICDWCGIRRAVDVNNGYAAIAEWEAVVGELDERPTSLVEAIDELGLESGLQTLCPECSQHVTWNEELELSAIDRTGEALHGARQGESG